MNNLVSIIQKRTSQGANPLGGPFVCVDCLTPLKRGAKQRCKNCFIKNVFTKSHAQRNRQEYLPCLMCGELNPRSNFQLVMTGKSIGTISKRYCNNCYKIYKKNKRDEDKALGRTYKRGYLKHRKDYCERCNFKGHFSQLDIHHVDRNHKNNEKNNLITLCSNCHRLQTFIERGGTYGIN